MRRASHLVELCVGRAAVMDVSHHFLGEREPEREREEQCQGGPEGSESQELHVPSIVPCPTEPNRRGGSVTQQSAERRVLGMALALNAAMFVVGLVAGLVGDSLGLVADSLDMLADAGAYGLGLAAIGRAAQFKTRVARLSGVLLLLLGSGVMIDAIRRAAGGSEPESGIIMITALASLAVNAYVIRTLTRFRRGEVHLRAAWLFTPGRRRREHWCDLRRTPAVMATGSAVPDLVAGVAIGLYVMSEALGILRGARG